MDPLPDVAHSTLQRKLHCSDFETLIFLILSRITWLHDAQTNILRTFTQ
jgi:hypothetical protein